MTTFDPATIAAVATAITAVLLQFMTTRLDTHRTEAHELRDEVKDLRARLEAAEQEADEWREKYFGAKGG